MWAEWELELLPQNSDSICICICICIYLFPKIPYTGMYPMDVGTLCRPTDTSQHSDGTVGTEITFLPS